MNDTKDVEAVKTLKLLYASHTRSAKELQRRLNAPIPERRFSQSESKTQKAVHLYSTTPVVATSAPSASTLGSRQFFVGQQDRSFAAPSNPITASIAQSYLILERDLPQSEEEDPFNKFWDAVEGLVQKISGPVAFTTVPIGKDDEMRINQRESRGSRPSSRENISDAASSLRGRESGFLNSYLIVPSEAFSRYSATNSSGKTMEEYEIENTQLKKTIDLLSNKVVALEKTHHENTMLRSSIIQFRQDIQKQRAMNSSIPPSRSGLPLRNLATSVQAQDSSDLQNKVEQLERELKKEKEKWHKLKESVKKKRESKSEVEGESLNRSNNSMYFSVT